MKTGIKRKTILMSKKKNQKTKKCSKVPEKDQILCMDCNEYLSSLPDESIDLIVTDIPYGIDYQSNKQNTNTRKSKSVKKDKKKYFKKIIGDDEIPLRWIEDAYRVLKDKTAIYIFCHWSKWHLLYPEVERVGFKIKNMIVLDKSNHGMGDLEGAYSPKHELLMFATKGRHLHRIKRRLSDVWKVPVLFSGSKRHHPNEKPLGWISPCILNSSDVGQLVLDPFAGSGTTGVVCRKEKRNFILIEKDEEHFETAQRRIIETYRVSKVF